MGHCKLLALMLGVLFVLGGVQTANAEFCPLPPPTEKYLTVNQGATFKIPIMPSNSQKPSYNWHYVKYLGTENGSYVFKALKKGETNILIPYDFWPISKIPSSVNWYITIE